MMNDIRNDSDIKILVHTFYGKVQDDERLGFIFNDFARVDWEKHLTNMVDFWSTCCSRPEGTKAALSASISLFR